MLFGFINIWWSSWHATTYSSSKQKKIFILYRVVKKVIQKMFGTRYVPSKLLTSTPSENLFLQHYKAQNKNFNFGITKTFILHTQSIIFTGGHLTKIWSEKIFIMKTLSKLGALTVHTVCQTFFGWLSSQHDTK